MLTGQRWSARARIWTIAVCALLLVPLGPGVAGATSTGACAPPAPDWPHFAPSLGTVRAAMLFVEFPDAPGHAPTTEVYDDIAPVAEQFFAENSYGQMTLDIVGHHEWLRMPAPSSDYPLLRSDNDVDERSYWDLAREAVAAADPAFDFSGIDILYTVSAEGADQDFSPAHTEAPGGGATADGNEILTYSSLGGDVYDRAPFVLPHETGHLLGQPDLYRYGEDYPELHRDVGAWDLMGDLDAGRHYSAYTKLRLGWLDGDRSICVTEEGEHRFTLSPLSRPDGLKAVLVPIAPAQAYVLEARHPEGFDNTICDGGLLIARADGTLEQGSIILQRAGEDDPGLVDDCGLLHAAPWTEGQTFQAEDIDLEVTVDAIAEDGSVTVTMQTPAYQAASGFDGDPRTTGRISEDDPRRFALALSRLRFDDGNADFGILSRDDAYPDSLAGAALSAGGPLLFTGTDELDEAVRDELIRVLPEGADVYLLGGERALSAAVEAAVVEAGLIPVRLRGDSRVETALAVADEIITRFGLPAEVALARSTHPPDNPTAGWADSVTAGAWAASRQVPVLLTPSDQLHDAVARWLDDHSVATTVLLGGRGALADAVEASVPGPRRVAGGERAGTAVQIADQLLGGTTRFLIINGYSEPGWAFGLAAAGWAAEAGAALLVSTATDLPEPTAARLARCEGANDAALAGGESLLGTSVHDAVSQATSACAAS